MFGHNNNGTGDMETAGSALKRMLPELVVSKQKLRQAEGGCAVRFKREEGKQNVGFSSRPFVLCGLPVRKPAAGEILYERRNGDFVLQITGHPNYGLPFGQDRTVPIYLATLAIRQQSQSIRFRTASEMLETFGMHKGGKEYRRLVAAFERIFGATIFFDTYTLNGKAKVVQRSRFSFFNEAQIWYSRDPGQCPSSDEFENIIVLSDQFYQEITSHASPADLEAVKVLVGAPACSISSCGSPTAAFERKEKRPFRWWGPKDSRARLAQSNTPGPDDFAKNSNNGWSSSMFFGPNARRASTQMGTV
ncbi:MAG: replication initiator protein A [Acidobacteriaceae bacterium]|nr:replication initiator protein A [Acidobacteriaceae bacterium]